MTSIIITGTDTGIGKTWVSLALMQGFKNLGEQVLGMKPVSSGCETEDGQLRNEDALLIQAACSKHVDYELVNPYAFAPPVSPHAAAEEAGVSIGLERILESYNILERQSDRVVIEGVGGWRVPFSNELSLKDLALELNLPVVMVVGMKLGCINHALLTAQAIMADGVQMKGWVANQIEPDYLMPDSTLETLQSAIQAPLLGVTPGLERLESDKLAEAISVDVLID